MNKIFTKIGKSKNKTPLWCNKLIISRQDVISVGQFYEHFEIKMDDVLQWFYDKFKAKRLCMTLDIQKIVIRCLMSDIASKKHGVFKDPLFRDISQQCAVELRNAEKYHKR